MKDGTVLQNSMNASKNIRRSSVGTANEHAAL